MVTSVGEDVGGDSEFTELRCCIGYYPLAGISDRLGMNVRDSGLAPDIPLGPFEGALITAYAASKATRLHARRDCPRLRTDHISELKVPLNAVSIERMCDDCARWGRWVPPETAAGIFLEVVSGYELPYELESYTEPDPGDLVTGKEITDAAALLRRGEYPSSEGLGEVGEQVDEDQWDAFRAARDLRDSQIIPKWCSAAESLMNAAEKVARYPWLKPWASKRLDQKAAHAEMLRRQAAQLLDSRALITASEAYRMPQPALPVGDRALTVLGSTSEVRRALESLWYDWHHQVSYGWLMPHEYDHLTHRLLERLGNKRKGRDELSALSRELQSDWADTALAAAASTENESDQLILTTIRLPERERDGRRRPLTHQLTKWEIGVLVVFGVAADWATRTFLLKVPQVVAERMLADDSSMINKVSPDHSEDAISFESLLARSADERLKEAGHGAFLPGVLDDTPVSQRRVVSLPEVRALREVLDEHRQLFIVCSVVNGIEIIPLVKVEERCKKGWSGVLVAEAGDLPSGLFASQLGEATTTHAEDENDDASARVWDNKYLSSEHPEFGGHLGDAAGERKLRWMHNRRDDIRLLERNSRIFALAKGMHDLRMLDHESDSGIPAVSREVWLALLLVRDYPDLQPFQPRDPEDRWNGGLGLPLGILADVQIYTTNADPRIIGKGHSPFCQHARDRGVRHDDFLLTLEAVMRRSDLDWCSNCGGYAMRRLSDEQISYYRVAHRLLDIDQTLTRELDGQGSQQVDLAGTNVAFDEISQWLYGGHERWQDADTWRVQDVVRELRGKAERLAGYRRDGWPNTGSVVQLKPKR
jgi:hypothetical protein